SRGRSSAACTRRTRSTSRRSPRTARWRLDTARGRPHVKGMHTPTMNLPDDPQPSLLTFPCVFPIKVMGRREVGIAQTVSEIVLRHADDFHPETIEMRSSKNGRYLSLTVTINARSREQLDALYSELSKHPMVMMVL